MKEIKPGFDAEKNAIMVRDSFPTNLTVHRHDRLTGISGGVFTAPIEGIVTDAQSQLSTDCEIIRFEVKAKARKTSTYAPFSSPQRSMTT